MAPCCWWAYIMLTKLVSPANMLVFSVVCWNCWSVSQHVDSQSLSLTNFEAIHSLRCSFSIFVSGELYNCVTSIHSLIVLGKFNWDDFSKRIEKLRDFLLRLCFKSTSETSNINPIVLLAFDWHDTLGGKCICSLVSLLLRTKRQ